jgi:hypothetical protein
MERQIELTQEISRLHESLGQVAASDGEQ